MKLRFNPVLLGMSAAFLLILGATGCARRAVEAPPEPAAAPPVATTAPVEVAPPVSEPPADPPPLAAPPAVDPAFFDFDSYALSQSAREALDRTAKVMRDRSDLTIMIEGHCDERGTSEYNLALGERRASAARAHLLTAGVEGDRMRIISYGKERPFVEGQDEAAWAQNRRAHIVVEMGSGSTAQRQ